MKSKLKPLPRFKTEAEERVFWEPRLNGVRGLVHSATGAIPESKAFDASHLVGLPVSLLEQIKVEANRRDVPYQSLIKVWLAEKAERGRGQIMG